MRQTFNRAGRHWCETVTAFMGITVGAAVLWGIHTSGLPGPPQSSLDVLPVWQSWATGGFMIAGSIVWLWSVLHWFDELTSMWAWRRVGASLAGIGWLVYAIAVLGAHPDSVTGWTIRAGVSAICWGAVGLSVSSERRTRDRISRMKGRR